jgi:hypothetical protein
MTEYNPADFPQTHKLDASSDTFNTVVEFLEWLQTTHSAHPCRWVEPTPTGEDRGFTARYLPLRRSVDKLAMEFMGIDHRALEEERRALLTILREAKVPE